MPLVRSATGLQNKMSVWKLSPYDLVKESQNKKNIILFQRKKWSCKPTRYMKGYLKSVEKNVLCTKNKLTERLLQHFVPIYLIYFSMFVCLFLSSFLYDSPSFYTSAVFLLYCIFFLFMFLLFLLFEDWVNNGDLGRSPSLLMQ